MIERTLGFVATVCVAAGLPQTHRSLAGVYGMTGEKELFGTVTSVKFTNPHGSLALAVKNQGGPAAGWVTTLGSAAALAQRGIGKSGSNALHTGEEIKVKFLPARDGKSAGLPQDRDHAGRARDPDLRR